MVEFTVEQALQKAIEAYKEGKIQEADRFYTAILKVNPQHPEANYNMGVLAVSVDKAAEALPFFKKALEANPRTAQFWLSYIDTLIKLNKLEDAKAVFVQAKNKGAKGDTFDKLEKRLLRMSKVESVKPSNSLLDDAIKLRESGNFTQAIDILKNEYNRFPHNSNILALLSHCYLLSGDIETATIQLDQAKSLNANSALVAWNEVRLLLHNKRVAEALVIARRANKLFPEDVEGMAVLGSCLRANNELKESIVFLNKAIELNPNYAEALINRGLIRIVQEDKVRALADLAKAHRLKPHIKQIWGTTANLQIEAKLYAEAIPLLVRMIEDDPTNERMFYSLGWCKYHLSQFEEAVEEYKKAIKLKPNFAEAYCKMGYAFFKQRKLEEAIEAYHMALASKPDFADAQVNLGNALKDQGQLEEAIKSYTKALAIKPDIVEALNNLGIILTNQGKYDVAIETFKRVIDTKQNLSYGYFNLGFAFQEKGELKEAIEAYHKALVKKPDFADAHFNLGNALFKQGKLEEAIEAYQKALASKPDFAEALFNLGNALNDQGKLGEAMEAYQKALASKPDFAEAHFNLGNVLYKQGSINKAVASYGKVLTFKPNFPECYVNIGLALKNFRFSEPNQRMQKIILALLQEHTFARPQDIEVAAISLLKLEPTIRELLAKHKKDQKIFRLQESVGVLSEFRILLKLMSVCPITDLEFESLFTQIRASLLFSVSDPKASFKKLCFHSALALQCFTNEYVYAQNDDEIKVVKDLEILVQKILSKGVQPNPSLVLCLASYKALHEYEWCDRLVVNADIKEVYTRQIIEPIRELHLRSTIPVLEAISNPVSSKVREQYEKNPYPRWVQLGSHLEPKLISKLVEENNLRLFDQRILRVNAPDILVAGCGTGQHSLDTAGRFLNSKVLAIDLSLSSLAYAKRKSEELEFKNIEYLQTDILNLGLLDRQFDIVESSGVLHHMDDPRAGWKVLVQCLKKGGLIKIGLYSELARQQIVQVRRMIKMSSVPPTAASMKSFRNRIISSNNAHHKKILNSADFFSLSSFRDLLFHVNEHRFTIPQIRDCVDELGLVFCGFESDHLIRYFQNTNNCSDNLYNLDKWNAFEQDNPDSFAGMYQFWCQKVG